jgi:hypothetical protein
MAERGIVFTMGTLVEVRADGKLYPPSRRSPAEVAQVRDLEHHLHCAGGLSIRATQAAMLDKHGIRRSVGMICRDLNQFECSHCSTAPKPRDPAQRPRAFAWR